jgi:hypothetical protein
LLVVRGDLEDLLNVAAYAIYILAIYIASRRTSPLALSNDPDSRGKHR